MYRGETISLEKKTLLLAILCLLFVLIGAVSASNVGDMLNNPDNNGLVSDSDESVANYDTNQLSNEDISSSDLSADSSLGSGKDTGDVKVASTSSGDSSVKANSSSSSSSGKNIEDLTPTDPNYKDNRGKTSMKLSSTKIHAGDPAVVTLKDNDGKGLKGKKVYFKVKNKSYTRTTDSKGQAKLSLNKIGSFKISVSFEGDKSFQSSKLSSTIKVLRSSTSFKVVSHKVPRTTHFVVTLRNQNGYAISGQKVSFKLPTRHNKAFKKTTDSKGQFKFFVNNSKKKFPILVVFKATDNFKGKTFKTYIKPTKCKTSMSSTDTELKYGEDLVVTLRKETNAPVKNKKVVVKITNKDKKYTIKTNSKGQALIPMNYLNTLDIKVSFAGNGNFIKSSLKTKVNVSQGTTKIVDSGDEVGKGFDYDIFLQNSAGKSLANKKVKITFNGKTVTKKTNSKGKVSLVMDYKKGSYPLVVSYTGDKYYNSSNLNKTLKIGDPAHSISKIVAAAKDLKSRVDYINILTKDYTVTIDKKVYTMDEFVYLMAGALTNIKSGSKANVKIKDLSNNYKSSGNKINGKLSKTEYLKLATEITKFVKSNNRIPNYKTTSLGKMEANLYIYAFTKILGSYDKNKKLPGSVQANTNDVRGGYSTSLSQGGKILNCRQIFNSATFAQYLKTGGKSALNSAIKNKAKALTAGLKTPMAKAIAIFRFVRDDISYSFYSNSRKGASGTLSSRSGNCCDKANLIVAMCRSVGVYARYSHAQGCKFQSGLYTGHVWAQVYDTQTQTWLTADATSFRNEVGKIRNWNTKSHYRDTNYVLIPF